MRIVAWQPPNRWLLVDDGQDESQLEATGYVVDPTKVARRVLVHSALRRGWWRTVPPNSPSVAELLEGKELESKPDWMMLGKY